MTLLREWRTGAGFTLEEAAALTGVSVSMWSRLERGERTCTPATKVKIARRLRAPVGALFEVEPLELTDA